MSRYAEIHSRVNRHYDSAVARYQAQRKAFIDALKSETIKDEKDFIEKLNTQIGAEVISENLQAEFDAAFSEIESEVARIYLEGSGQEFFGSAEQGLLKKRKNSARSRNGITEDSMERYYNRMIKDIENFLSTNQMTRAYVNKIISAHSLSPSSATEGVILNQFYGYARRVMFSIALGQQAGVSTARYKASLKGYYKEDLITEGLNAVLNKMGLAAYGTGAIPNEEGLQIEMDIFIGKKMRASKKSSIIDRLTEKLKPLTGLTAEASVDMGQPTNIGMQSKSWIEPWAEGTGGNRQFLSVGHRTQLLNSVRPEGLYSWHDGIDIAAQNMQKILGVNNVLFATGAGVKWTADLISEMRDNNYFLAFYISKKSGMATGEVVWETDPGHQ